MESNLEMCKKVISNFGFINCEDKNKMKEYRVYISDIKDELTYFKKFERFICFIKIFPKDNKIKIKVYGGGYGESDWIGPPLTSESELIKFIQSNT